MAGILPQQNNGWALCEFLLLERCAADAGPCLRNNVLLVIWLGSLTQANIVKAMLISRVFSGTPKEGQKIIAVISGNKEKTVPVPILLALVVIDVVNQGW